MLDLHHTPVFECLVVFASFIFLPLKDLNYHLRPQAAKYVFIRYSDDHKGFLCYDPVACKARISENFVFLDTVLSILFRSGRNVPESTKFEIKWTLKRFRSKFWSVLANSSLNCVVPAGTDKMVQFWLEQPVTLFFFLFPPTTPATVHFPLITRAEM